MVQLLRTAYYGVLSIWVVCVHTKFDELGRFADPSVLILTSLAEGPKHGYAIMTDVAEFSGVGMEPGTLYGALARLERQGWVKPPGTEARRRPYPITAAGLASSAASAGFLALTVGWRLIVGEEPDFGRLGAHDAASSADGRLVATTSGAATVRLWDATRPNQPVRLSSFDGGIHVALTP